MNSIVVGTDFSKGSLVALEIATHIANKLKTDISLLWVQQASGLFGMGYDKQTEELAAHRLQELVAEYSKYMTDGKIHAEIAKGKVSAAIAEKAKKENSPIIVIGTNGASGFEKYWMGSTAVRIVTESPCPTLTVREGYNFHKTLEKIIVPLRPNSDNTRQKVPPAATIARIFGSTVHLLGLYNVASEANELRIILDQASQYMYKEGVEHTAAIRQVNNYCDEVMKYAEEVKADLLVINTEQDKPLQQLFLSTNAQQIVHKSQIPVLCVHPEDIFNVAR